MKQLLRTFLLLALLLSATLPPASAEERGWRVAENGSPAQSTSRGGERHVRFGDQDGKDDRGRGRGRDRDRDRGDDGKRGDDDDSRTIISLSEAVKRARQQYGADVVRAETRSERGRTVYHLLLHSEGRVWTVRVDARTGEMQ